MSEAMSSVEIEDVLSSIRRLVSEDLRPGMRPASARQPEEKLLLTPAFRVATEAAPPIPPQGEPAASPSRPAPLPRLHLGAGPVIERLAATLERAVEAQDVEWESETGDPVPMVSQMEWTETGWKTVEQDPVAPEAAVPDRQADDPTPAWAQDDPEPAETAGFEPAHNRPIAEPDAYWADQAEAEAVAELRAEDAGQFAASDAEVTFDEQVLRDLVRDLIREELQGGLGERITRNVRKLVRAEIARALAAQELE